MWFTRPIVSVLFLLSASHNYCCPIIISHISCWDHWYAMPCVVMIIISTVKRDDLNNASAVGLMKINGSSSPECAVCSPWSMFLAGMQLFVFVLSGVTPGCVFINSAVIYQTAFRSPDIGLSRVVGLSTFNVRYKLNCLSLWMCLLQMGHENLVARLMYYIGLVSRRVSSH